MWYILYFFYYCTCTTGTPIRYNWMQNDTWSPCSVECGQGVSEAIFKCYDTVTSKVVIETLCTDPKPSIRKECFDKPCLKNVGYEDYKLYAAQYDDVLDRQYQDIEFDNKPYAGFESMNQRLYDSIYNKPYTGIENINLKPYAGLENNQKQRTVLEDLTQKALSGLENVQYDPANALESSFDRQYDDLVSVNRTNYEGTEYTNYRHDNTKPPYAGHWFIGEWGECSVTCGRGTISREYACVNRDNTAVLADTDCPGEKPKAYKICDLKQCVEVYAWHIGRWSECPEDCDSKRRRKVFCKSIAGRKVHDLYCIKAGEKPQSSQTCGRPCVRWVAGRWRECKYKRERSCRDAVQTRCVICIHEKTFQMSNLCEHKTKPIRKRSCSKHACARQL